MTTVLVLLAIAIILLLDAVCPKNTKHEFIVKDFGIIEVIPEDPTNVTGLA